ncbi:MAG: D-Ala-D-Ala carboxypeptidase family metallohydrolase [Gammaproteobacteria bacterium]|nr:hypothetical protein [Pseudomonadales bacterium]MCP5347861.1 hypothetical protein [Pseudomonadales bacterium]
MKLLPLITCVLFGFSSLALADSKRVDFTIAFQEVETNLGIITTSVMPSDRLTITTLADARSESGTLARIKDGWEWQAPATPGHYPVTFEYLSEKIVLQVFVLTPFKNGEEDSLDGFRIGSYVKELFRGLATYSPPRGFVSLAYAPPELAVSPSFTVSQFISKQQPDHGPGYLLVLPAMLIKLETLLEAANQNGWSAPTLYVMSGFRTPYYNRSIGNNTSTSRHLYGGAADVWIDGDGDGQMDDLNADGQITRDDAVILASLAESLALKGGRDWPVGGIGIYDATAYHGPFVHIDARGYRARW